MIEIAIVEDEKREAELLERFLTEFAAAHGRKFSVTKFNNPNKFLENFNLNYDIVFLDICMPELSGMDVAHKIRETNSEVVIIFVTNMLQYAVEGYSVQASDFIVKPANSVSVNRIMSRIITHLDRNEEKSIIIKDSSNGETVTLKVGDIYYVEVSRHRLTWHTSLGEFSGWGTMSAVQEQLPAKSFSRCHISFIVNLKHVKGTKKDTVTVGEDVLPVSRSCKSAFYADLATYLGETR